MPEGTCRGRKKAKQDAQKEKGPPLGAKHKKPEDDEKVECQYCKFELNSQSVITTMTASKERGRSKRMAVMAVVK